MPKPSGVMKSRGMNFSTFATLLSGATPTFHLPIYQATAAYGHFGRTDLNLPWEDTGRAEALRAEAGL